MSQSETKSTSELNALNENKLQQYFRDDVLAMRPYVPGEQPQTGKVIKLNTNENPYPPSPKVPEAIRYASGHRLERYPDPLATAFCIAAADLLGVQADNVLCGNGSDDILTILTRSFIGRDQCLRMPTPSYVLYKTLANIQGVEVEEIEFNRDFSLPEKFAALNNSSKPPGLAFLPNPNSPSGTVVSQKQILEIADRLPCPLVVDEAYVDFAKESAVGLIAEQPKIMVTRTLSKSYGLAGMRFGYLVADPTIIGQLRKVKDSYNCDALAIAGATAAISDQNWLRENVSKIHSTRTRMESELTELGFDVTPSQANFVWCTHREWNLRDIYEQLKSNRILVRYMSFDQWGDGIRISVGSDNEIDAALAILRSIL